MTREISAGGVVLRQISGAWHVALIEAQREGSGTAKKNSSAARSRAKQGRAVLSLPKGLVDTGEKAEATAIREVYEETGVRAEALVKLADIKYVYVRAWGDGGRVFKIVSFFLMRYLSGEIDDLAEEMRIEVKRALWVPLAEAGRQMAYSSERKVLGQAREYIETGNFVGKTASTGGEKPSAGSHTDV